MAGQPATRPRHRHGPPHPDGEIIKPHYTGAALVICQANANSQMA